MSTVRTISRATTATHPRKLTGCRFCNDDSAPAGREYGWNRPLFETRNFLVLPSLGALVEGWLLLLPKRHVISFGFLAHELTAEYRTLQRLVTDAVTDMYGCVSLFEHGPAAERRNVGCTVDHAHLHIVPTDVDLEGAVSPYLQPDAVWRDGDLATCQEAARRGIDYLYLERPLGRGRILTHAGLGSQLFRRAIADQLGVPNEYDWREHPQEERVVATIKAVSSAGHFKTSVGFG